MEYYDYCVLAGDEAEEAKALAGQLGFAGICMLSEKPGEGKAVEGRAAKPGKLDVAQGLLIQTDKPAVLKKEVASNRQRFAIIAARGLSDEANRAAAETPMLDMLLPGAGSRIDYVMVQLAKKNDVAIGFEFMSLLQSSGQTRSALFSRMLETAKLVKKFAAPFVLVSGALSAWDIRAPSELMALGKVLGLDQPRIKQSMTAARLEHNRSKLGGRWVMPGVEIESGSGVDRDEA